MRRQDIKQGIRDAEPVHRCWAPTGRRQCSNECIKSHTVQKSLLDRMARNHKVYSTRWTNMIGKNGEVIDRDGRARDRAGGPSQSNGNRNIPGGEGGARHGLRGLGDRVGRWAMVDVLGNPNVSNRSRQHNAGGMDGGDKTGG